MAAVTKYRNGVPNWADVTATDIAAASEFYAALFGWQTEDQGEEAGHYTMCSIDGRSVAAIGPAMEGMAIPIWGAYVSVDDLDATLATVEPAGGQVLMERMDVFSSGSMAVIADPSGAVLSLWQPGEHIGAELVNEPNTIAWHELTTRDGDAAKAFFGEVLGWTFQAVPGGAGDGYQMITVGERGVGGILPMAGDDWGDLPSHWMVYIRVDDTDAMAAKVSELGGAVSVEPFDLPVGRTAVVNDPEGNAFSIIAFSGEVDAIPDGVA